MLIRTTIYKAHVPLPWPVVIEACSTLLGWTLVIVGVNFTAFFVGYWSGHRGIPGWDQTLRALAYVPLVWLGSPAMIGAYVASLLTWHLPIHYDLPRARWWMLGANGLLWIGGICSVVRATQGSKFFHF